jgi:hypothetical protein
MPSGKALLAVLTGILTLWVVPLLTRQSQDRAMARDLKAQLAGDMSSFFAEFDSIAVLRTYDLVQKNLAGEVLFSTEGMITKPPPRKIFDQARFNAVYRKWQHDANVVGTKLRAYFSDDPSLGDAWSSFSIAAARFYFLSENTRDADTLSGRVSAFGTSVDRLNDWAPFLGTDRLLTLTEAEVAALKRGQTRRDEIDAFFSAYDGVSVKLISAHDAIVKRMRRTHVQGFSTRPCDLFSTLFALEPGKLCIGLI